MTAFLLQRDVDDPDPRRASSEPTDLNLMRAGRGGERRLATARLRALLALGTVSMLVGLVLLVTAVRLSSPSLALFLIGGAFIAPGGGAVFKGTTGIVLEAVAPEERLAMTSQLLIVLSSGSRFP